jgi:NhaA family Na+:H+ antiporter
MEHVLSPWVTYVILPIFACSNIGIDLRDFGSTTAVSSITLGALLGLVPGKFIGITLFSRLAVSLRIGRLPNGVDWWQLTGVAWLAGIGFTMSLFVNNLAFSEPIQIEEAKAGVLAASVIAGAIGLAWLYFGAGKAKPLMGSRGQGVI